MKINFSKDSTPEAIRIRDVPFGTFFYMLGEKDILYLMGKDSYFNFGVWGVFGYSLEGSICDKCVVIVPHENITINVKLPL